ncbi:MAG: hypothetical protein ACLGIJ_11460 [Candidatus Limnocylindria bacterium]
MSDPSGEREIDALVVDRYLEALLSRRPADLTDLPAGMRASAVALYGELPRFHPSFRFEDALASRLAAAARAEALAAAARAEAAGAEAAPPVDRSVVELASHPATGAAPAVRPVLIGGVLTSAVLSIAGALYMAWRWTHPSARTTMARAVRAAARARTA